MSAPTTGPTQTELSIMFPIVRDYHRYLAAGGVANVRKAKLAYDAMTSKARKQIVRFRLPALPDWVWE